MVGADEPTNTSRPQLKIYLLLAFVINRPGLAHRRQEVDHALLLRSDARLEALHNVDKVLGRAIARSLNALKC